MPAQRTSLAMRPRSLRARAALTIPRSAYASAPLRPHVDANAADPVAIGRHALQPPCSDAAAPGFETHWTRILHHDLFTRPDAPSPRGPSTNPTIGATKGPRETLASGPTVTTHALPASRHWSAGNDPTCEEMRTPAVLPGLRGRPGRNVVACDDPSGRARDIERRARNALATMRLAYAAPGNDAWAASAAAARTPRLANVAQPMHAAFDAIVTLARGLLARRRRRLQARAICESLRACDDRTLRDLGLHRSEITSLAAEATGAAACTRERIHRLHRRPR
ncbi:MAG: DUF1127 domain-containing protein [Rudaea sp.]